MDVAARAELGRDETFVVGVCAIAVVIGGPPEGGGTTRGDPEGVFSMYMKLGDAVVERALWGRRGVCGEVIVVELVRALLNALGRSYTAKSPREVEPLTEGGKASLDRGRMGTPGRDSAC